MTNEQAFRRAKALTAQNAHQHAVLLIATHFQCKQIAKSVEGVIMIQEARGHLDHPLSEFMHLLRKDLYDMIEIAHGKEVRDAVYACF